MKEPILALKLLVATMAAAAMAYYAIAWINISGLMPYDFSASVIIRERCPAHIVSPSSINSHDQSDMLSRWAVAETKARLGVVGALWVLAIGCLLGRHLMNCRRDCPGLRLK